MLTCNEENKKIAVDGQGNASIVDAGKQITIHYEWGELIGRWDREIVPERDIEPSLQQDADRFAIGSRLAGAPSRLEQGIACARYEHSVYRHLRLQSLFECVERHHAEQLPFGRRQGRLDAECDIQPIPLKPNCHGRQLSGATP